MIITLPSNGSQKFHPENKASSFNIQLPRPLNLKGEGWEVGLVELSYTNSFHNLIDPYVIIGKASDLTVRDKIDLPTGTYQKSAEVLQHIQRAVTQSVESNQFSIAVDPISEITSILIRFNGFVQLSENLAGMLGFKQNKFEGFNKIYRSERAFDLSGGVYGIFVYCDLVEPVIVGHTMAPLLRIVPIEGKKEEYVTKTYDKIIYAPLSSKNTNSIKIDLKTDTGTNVPFAKGKTNCVLHIRQASEGLRQ